MITPKSNISNFWVIILGIAAILDGIIMICSLGFLTGKFQLMGNYVRYRSQDKKKKSE